MAQGSKSGFAWAGGWFATLLAFIGAVFLVPELWPLVAKAVWVALIERYPPDTARLLDWLGWVGSYPFTFFALRLALSLIVFAITIKLRRRRI